MNRSAVFDVNYSSCRWRAQASAPTHQPAPHCPALASPMGVASPSVLHRGGGGWNFFSRILISSELSRCSLIPPFLWARSSLRHEEDQLGLSVGPQSLAGTGEHVRASSREGPGSQHGEWALQCSAICVWELRGPDLLLLFSRSVVSDSLRPHGPQHTRPPCPSPSPEACSN